MHRLTSLILLFALAAGISATHADQIFYVDFDTIKDAVDADPSKIGDPGFPGAADEVFDYDTVVDFGGGPTPARDFILEYLNSNYGGYGMTFEEGPKPAPGFGSNITLNKTFGAGAEQVDFRNLDDDDDADVNTISIFKFLGETSWTDAEVAVATAKIAAHEAEHLMGARHHDQLSPLNGGLLPPPGGVEAADFLPTYPVGMPTDAIESSKTFTSLHVGGSLSFENLTSAPDTTFVSERIIPRLAVADDFAAPLGETFVTVDDGDNNTFPEAQTIETVTPFALPYPLRPTPVPFDLIQGKAAVVTGELEVKDDSVPPDYYEFFGEAGEKWTIEAMSYLLPDPDGDGKRYADNADVAILLLAGLGSPDGFTDGDIIDYYGAPFGAMNDDDDDITDGDGPLLGATLIDIILPYSGSYVIEVVAAEDFLGTGKPDTSIGEDVDSGSYELFLYEARPTVIPEPASLACLALGGLATLRRRCRHRRPTEGPCLRFRSR